MHPIWGTDRLRAVKVLEEQRDVAAIGAKHDVESIANKWNCSDKTIERNIGEHPADQQAGYPQGARLVDDVQRQDRGNHVTDAGDQADHSVDTKPDVCSRNKKRGIEELRERVDPRHALFAGQQALRVECEFGKRASPHVH